MICFDNPPDAVFMKCGHGGVCYTCAMDIWKRNAECYLCRKEIAAVYQLSMQKGEYFEVIAETHAAWKGLRDGSIDAGKLWTGK